MELVLYEEKGKMRSYYNEKSPLDGKYHIIPISTDRKGPVYTIVDDDFIIMHKRSQNDIKMTFEIDFGEYDNYRTRPTNILVPNSKGISHYANLMPLVFQIFMMGNWLQISDSIYCIDIVHLDISVNGVVSTINFSESLKAPRKSFQKLGLNTVCEKIFGSSLEWSESLCPVIILNENRTWKYIPIEEASDAVFDYIIIPVIGAESVYVLSFREFQIFSMIDILCVGVSGREFSGIDAGFGSFSNGITEVLESCLFFPQLILMLSEIYEYQDGWELRVHLNDIASEYHLSVDSVMLKKNTSKNTSLFRILKEFICYLRDIPE